MIDKKSGYEFGGLDFVDRTRSHWDTGATQTHHVSNLERWKPGMTYSQVPVGYQMGAVDYRKGSLRPAANYHGHGPAPRKLHPRFEDEVLKHDQLNIEQAPNVDSVSADVLVGDTISNQHIQREHQPDQSFGTPFGPVIRYKHHNPPPTVHRQPNQPSVERDLGRSRSALPMDRQQWMGESTDHKEVTVQTLLNDQALIASKKTMIPDWHMRSLEKSKRWKNGSDPLLYKPKSFEYEPSWSKIVSNRRSVWEEKAKNVDAFVQMPPNSKIAAQRQPHWYQKANQLHELWQTEADRQKNTQEQWKHGSHLVDYNQKQHQERYHSTEVDGGGLETEAQPNRMDERRENQSDFTAEIKYSAPVRQQPSPFYIQQQTVDSADQQQTIKRPQSPSFVTKNYADGSFTRHKQQLYEYSAKRLTEGESEKRMVHGADFQTNYDQFGHRNAGDEPLATATTLITKTGGEFNRQEEMSETLPLGTVANTKASTEGNYVDSSGQPVTYRREVVSSVNPNNESMLLKEEESRIIEKPLEPGVISRHVTTKYYKKKTVTDTTVTNSVM